MHCKYDGEERGNADRNEGPDEEECSAGIADAARDANASSLHVNDGDGDSKKREEKDDDVARSPLGKHERSVQPDHNEGHGGEIREPSPFEAANDVVSEVKRKE